MRLIGRVAIVTGGARGIGRAIAERLSEEGARVVVGDMNPEGEVVCRSLMDQGREALFVQSDVSRAPDADELVARAVAVYGGLDILINNAGIGIFKSLEATTEGEWDRVIAVNLKSIYLCSRRAIACMRARGGGVIINLASVHSYASFSGSAVYAASKGAVLALTRQMALDLAADGIRVNCLAPGVIDTDMLRSSLKNQADPSAELRQWGAKHALGRVGLPEEVASAAVFLASDDASLITGSPLFVDGGMLAKLP